MVSYFCKKNKDMAAEKGNQYHLLRKKIGRGKAFDTPEALWEVAVKYFKWCDDNPWEKVEAIKSGEWAGKMINIPTQRPYSISGFLIYAGVGRNYWTQFKQRKNIEEYEEVIERIEMIIETQQFEGAAVGAFNVNIIMRKLGMSEQQEINVTNRNSEPTRVVFENYGDKV